ncbi:hypothetical protein [Enterococcus sp. HY326]|uniref:hypothetical protein n=1 Tax=Enterococcus sp. HY326 TaxID=2971265 RepID=UPI00223F5CC8|nr:hypothetical protein [Enterococcus sp. HY326]
MDSLKHAVHEKHSHEHSLSCGHTKILHKDHVDYVHDGHLHHKHENHWDECAIEISEKNPNACNHVEEPCLHNDDCGHEKIQHGDHLDYIVEGRLQHVHEKHVDDHGAIEIL